MADGAFLMRDPTVLTLDEPKLLQEANRSPSVCGNGCWHAAPISPLRPVGCTE
jgi:hypothetical protein